MPAKVVRQHGTANANNLTAEMLNQQYRAPETIVQDEHSSGGTSQNIRVLARLVIIPQLTETITEGRARKRLQKSPSLKSLSSRQPEEPPSNNIPESRSNIASRRRQSLRDPKVPLGARPLQRSPSKQYVSLYGHFYTL